MDATCQKGISLHVRSWKDAWALVFTFNLISYANTMGSKTYPLGEWYRGGGFRKPWRNVRHALLLCGYCVGAALRMGDTVQLLACHSQTVARIKTCTATCRGVGIHEFVGNSLIIKARLRAYSKRELLKIGNFQLPMYSCLMWRLLITVKNTVNIVFKIILKAFRGNKRRTVTNK